ncbi:MAG: ATP-binding cassette domain-containing protein, partial [Nitrospiria bacterium]
VQQRLGYLPESLPAYPEMAVADYLDYAAQLKGLTGDAYNSEIRRVIRATDITEKLASPIATLSRGYKQRVGVAQALLGKPKLLILDEPTNGLDPTQTQHMRALIKTIANEATVILSTHIMQEVDALCDRVLILRNGVLALNAKLDTLRESHALTIRTDIADLTSAKQLLAGIPGLASLEALPSQSGAKCYRMRLSENADAPSAAAETAKRLVSAKQALFELTLEHRDLETVFREVTEAGETAHAA